MDTDTNHRRPRVTVAMPSYNQRSFVEQSVESILAAGDDAETLVVDGGSDDGTVEILKRLERRLDRLIVESDRGQSDAIAKALHVANGQWFGWINSDDLLNPGAVDHLVRVDSARYDLVAMNVAVVGDGADYVIDQRNLSARTILRSDDYSFGQPGLWFQTEKLRAIGGLQTDLHYGFDWDLLVRYLAHYPRVAYVDHVGATFRVHPGSKTSIESAKNDDENRFKQEMDVIRDRLEATLPPRLVRDSRLGRRRGPWHGHLIRQLDRPGTSPALLAATLMGQSLADPPARWSRRFFGSIVRLLSRYVRPKMWRQNSAPIKG